MIEFVFYSLALVLLLVIYLGRKVLTIVVRALLVHIVRRWIGLKKRKRPINDTKPGGINDGEVCRRKKFVAVIGGGPSGVAAAKCLMDDGHEVVLFEKAGCVGGNWYVYC